jgi:hypothetical protein
MSRAHRNRLWPALLLVWAAAICVGGMRLWRYSGTPGLAAASARLLWPQHIPLRPAPQGITLVVSLHPKCPCSRATVSELARLMTRGNAEAFALFVRPHGLPEGWERTDLWDAAAAIPGVTVVTDHEGAWSTRFGAMTSGQICAFDGQGHLLFSGGITPARGHMGDNAGSDAIAELIAGRQPLRASSPVFGCALGTEQCRAPAADPLGDRLGDRPGDQTSAGGEP